MGACVRVCFSVCVWPLFLSRIALGFLSRFLFPRLGLLVACEKQKKACVCTSLPPLLNLSRISCLPRSQPRGYALVCRRHEASGAEIVSARHSVRTRRRRHRARERIFFLTCPRKKLWPCWCEMVSYPQNLQSVTLRMCRFCVCVCVSFSRNHGKDTDTHTRHPERLAYTHAHLFSHAIHHQCAYTLSNTRVHTFTHTEQVHVHTHTHTHTA